MNEMSHKNDYKLTRAIFTYTHDFNIHHGIFPTLLPTKIVEIEVKAPKHIRKGSFRQMLELSRMKCMQLNGKYEGFNLVSSALSSSI